MQLRTFPINASDGLQLRWGLTMLTEPAVRSHWSCMFFPAACFRHGRTHPSCMRMRIPPPIYVGELLLPLLSTGRRPGAVSTSIRPAECRCCVAGGGIALPSGGGRISIPSP